tara:strand:+ start:2992 stop:3405 length:414 start_codon:yes stop_codon:yes gene_type:complete
MEKYLTILRGDGVLKEWCDRKILAGSHIQNNIQRELEAADIVVFLVSIDFLNSKACQEEWELAKKLAEESEKRLISIIVRKCPWTDFDNMKDSLVLPTDGKEIVSWNNVDDAWFDVYTGMKKVINDIKMTFEVKKNS